MAALGLLVPVSSRPYRCMAAHVVQAESFVDTMTEMSQTLQRVAARQFPREQSVPAPTFPSFMPSAVPSHMQLLPQPTSHGIP